MKSNKLDLRQVNPAGRIDVLAYKAAEQLTNTLAEKVGVQGVWSAIESDVQDLVVAGLSGIEIPPACRILLAIFQANMIKDHLWRQQAK